MKWNIHISNVCTKANRIRILEEKFVFWTPDVKEAAAYKGLVRPVLEYGSSFGDPHTHGLQEELEKVQNRAARFVTGNYVFETGSMTGILGQLKWESLRKGGRIVRIILLYKGLKGKARIYPQMTLSRRIGVLEINSLWLFRYLQPAKKRTQVVSFHRLPGTGMTSLIL